MKKAVCIRDWRPAKLKEGNFRGEHDRDHSNAARSQNFIILNPKYIDFPRSAINRLKMDNTKVILSTHPSSTQDKIFKLLKFLRLLFICKLVTYLLVMTIPWMYVRRCWR